jgi:hypothetical protein
MRPDFSNVPSTLCSPVYPLQLKAEAFLSTESSGEVLAWHE